MEEEWKGIDGFRDYEVSNMGRIRSLKWGKQRILKDRKDGCGYSQAILCRDGGEHSHKVHRLVALAFVANPENKPQIDHINRTISDNRAENLRWVTRDENMLNTHRHHHDMYSIRWLADIRKYKVQINIKKKQTYLGCFDTFEQAKTARDAYLEVAQLPRVEVAEEPTI
jgi:hypothetical protein